MGKDIGEARRVNKAKTSGSNYGRTFLRPSFCRPRNYEANHAATAESPSKINPIALSQQTTSLNAMPPRPSHKSTLVAAPRLPPVPKVRIRQPNALEANPCLGIMASVLGKVIFSYAVSFAKTEQHYASFGTIRGRLVDPCKKQTERRPESLIGLSAETLTSFAVRTLGCWASTGQATATCAVLEQQLRDCMDAPVRKPPSQPFRAPTLPDEHLPS